MIQVASVSPLIKAGLPPGTDDATDIIVPRLWRSLDALRGEGYARRLRIRERKVLREPFVYTHRVVEHVPHTVTRGATGGRVA